MELVSRLVYVASPTISMLVSSVHAVFFLLFRPLYFLAFIFWHCAHSTELSQLVDVGRLSLETLYSERAGRVGQRSHVFGPKGKL